MTKVIITDGGRKAAGYKGTANDCVTRAFAIARSLPYKLAYQEVARFLERQIDGGTPRQGVPADYTKKFFAQMGWRFVDTMTIGGGKPFTIDELPGGTVIALVDSHVFAVIDKTVHDAYDPTKGGDDSVIGYWVRS